MQEYIPALFVHWVYLMSGMASVLMVLALRIGRRISKAVKRWTDLPDILLISIGIVCLFVAGYSTWQDKNNELIKLQEKLRTPELGGKIDYLTGFSQRGFRFIFVYGLITNPLGPPTAISNWEMNVEYPDRHFVKGEAPLTSGEDLKIPLGGQNGTFLFPGKNYWPDKSVNPIPAGGSMDGWYWSTFNNLDMNDAYKKKASVVMYFYDVVSNKKHRLAAVLKEGIHLPAYNMP